MTIDCRVLLVEICGSWQTRGVVSPLSTGRCCVMNHSASFCVKRALYTRQNNSLGLIRPARVHWLSPLRRELYSLHCFYLWMPESLQIGSWFICSNRHLMRPQSRFHSTSYQHSFSGYCRLVIVSFIIQKFLQKSKNGGIYIYKCSNKKEWMSKLYLFKCVIQVFFNRDIMRRKKLFLHFSVCFFSRK